MTNDLFQAYLDGEIKKSGISDWTQFSNDDVIEALNGCYIHAFIPEIIKTHNIPEDVYVDFIKKNPTIKYITHSNLLERIVACKQMQTHDILFELALCNPITAVYDAYECTGVIFTKDEYLKIADVYFQNKYLNRFTWRGEFPMEERHWNIVLKNKNKRHIHFESYINRTDRPQKALHTYLKYCSSAQLYRIKNFTTDDLIYWLEWSEKHKKPQDFASDCKNIFNNDGYGLTDMDFTPIINKHPSYIQYIKNPSMDLCKMIINQDIKNVQYIHMDSTDPYWYALQLSLSAITYIDKQHVTDRMRQFANTPFTYKYYLVDVNVNTCDGKQIHYKCAIKGDKMHDFLNNTFSAYLNGWCVAKDLYVKDYMTFVPITTQEYKTLSKFNMVNCKYCECTDMNADIKFD